MGFFRSFSVNLHGVHALAILFLIFIGFGPNFALANAEIPRIQGNKLFKLWVKLNAPEGKPWSIDPRQQAILEAHREAFRVMSVYVSGQEPSKIPPDNTLFGLVESFSVEQEKVNQVSYQCRFSFTFKPEALERTFSLVLEKARHGEEGESRKEFDMQHQSPSLILSARLRGFSDWVALQRVLDRCGPALAQCKILSLSQEHGIVKVTWDGSIENFEGRLRNAGFQILQRPGEWEIERVSARTSQEVTPPATFEEHAS